VIALFRGFETYKINFKVFFDGQYLAHYLKTDGFVGVYCEYIVIVI